LIQALSCQLLQLLLNGSERVQDCAEVAGLVATFATLVDSATVRDGGLLRPAEEKEDQKVQPGATEEREKK
jgi:hypothetical protein